ncbi:hypothetical protein ColLi_12850 [Colletotrichum liriopes]|uniref:Uncharacterized protein n=1 Tax=Colletotrichum liriopes TaxID=708192 RepID=A0AA37LZ07_9PEZI|nr:hypothetical protein ColLi_12850 [Colletotrichum liriopes]
MDQRSRAGRPNRRKTLPTSSIQSDTSAGGESTSTIMTRSPPVAASRTPQTAPPNRRSAKPIPINSPFSLRSSPSTSAPGPGKTALRKKSRTGFDGAADEEDEIYRKGPHTLRKRAKIDYSAADFEDELPEIAIPAPRTATRKRRADSEVADDEYSTPAAQKRRATSRDFSVASGAAARRRTPARRSVVEQQSFYSQPSDEDIVKDTIEVVGDSSDLVSSDDASDHEDDEHDVSGRISLPEKHEQPSSPIQRKTQEVHQLVSPVDQQIIKRDDRQSSQAQDVSGVVAASDMGSGPIIAHPQPIRVNQVTIINRAAGPRPEAGPVSTHRAELSEDFSIQPKREASSPVRPAESLPQRTALPEAAGSATGPAAVVLGSQENSAPAVAENHDAAASHNDHVTVAQPVEEAPRPVFQRNAHEAIVNGHVEATEYDLPSRKQPRSAQHPAADTAAAIHDTEKHLVDVAESFTTQADKSSRAKDEMDVDASEESDAEMQDHGPVQPPKAASPQPTSISKPTKKRYAWSHLTPYIDGEYVTHSIYPVTVEASAPTSNADAAEAGGDTENADDAAYQPDPNADYKHGEADVDEDGNVDADGEVDDGDRDAEQDEDLAPDSQGQQLSQGSAYNSAAPTPALTPRQGSPVLPSAITGTNTPAPLMPKQRFRKQYKFKKVRDPAEFAAYLKDTKDLSDEELWYLLEKANECLVAYQEEYKKCTRIVDDQENAQRRAVQDAAFEKKTADLNAFAKVDSYIEKDFDVQGSRATIKEKDAGILDQRWQDRIMANAYGFEYDPHPNKIGNQDPGAQRDGGGEGGRQLRSQPQASAKAAEGDGVIVSGKRTRNPPKLFEGVLQDDHRAATPGSNKPGPKRRGRAAAADRAAAQDQELEDPEPQTTSPPKPGPKKRGPRGRKAAVVVSEPGTPVPEDDAIAPPPEPEHAQLPKRKRGRQPKSAVVVAEEPDPEEPERPTPKRIRAAKRQSNGHVTTTAETTDESRPTSSSSNATISDDGSTYGLRQNKRQRNWKEEAGADEEEAEPEPPQPKKARIIRINRKQSAPELTAKKTASERILTELHHFSTLSTAPDSPRLTVSFKLIGKDQWTLKPAASPRQTSTDASEYNMSTPRPAPVSAPASAKSSAPPSQAGEEKDYSTMTKSEKMSASMKKRWLNGSMQGAVNKRKATLAAKKQAAALAEAQAAQAAQQKAMPFQQIGPFPMGPSQ